MKILHFSDLHLDVPFAGNGMPLDVARLCRMRLRKTLLRLLDFAVEEEVDVVTIGGDLFEGDRVSRDTINFLKDSFELLAPIPILIAPGNHDHFSPASPYARNNWPENVKIFQSTAPEPVALIDDVVVWGMAHTTPSLRKNLLEGVVVPDDGQTHILIMHGSETGNFSENRAAHAPFQLRDLVAAGYAFGLLGHYHGAKLLSDGAPKAVYPGSPQPLNFGESGEHGVVLLRVENGDISCKIIQVATQAFLTVTFAPEAITDNHNLAEEILSRVEKPVAEAAFLRVVLTGIQQKELQLDLEYLRDFLLNHFEHVVIQNNMRASFDIEALSQEPTVRGAYIRRLQQMMTEETDDRELIRLALRYGLNAFEGDEIIHS